MELQHLFLQFPLRCDVIVVVVVAVIRTLPRILHGWRWRSRSAVLLLAPTSARRGTFRRPPSFAPHLRGCRCAVRWVANCHEPEVLAARLDRLGQRQRATLCSRLRGAPHPLPFLAYFYLRWLVGWSGWLVLSLMLRSFAFLSGLCVSFCRQPSDNSTYHTLQCRICFLEYVRLRTYAWNTSAARASLNGNQRRSTAATIMMPRTDEYRITYILWQYNSRCAVDCTRTDYVVVRTVHFGEPTPVSPPRPSGAPFRWHSSLALHSALSILHYCTPW